MDSWRAPPDVHQLHFRISLRMTGSMGGRPRRLRLLILVQYRRKPCRCQRTTVSGVTMRSNSRHRGQHLDSITQNSRSNGRKRGRFVER